MFFCGINKNFREMANFYKKRARRTKSTRRPARRVRSGVAKNTKIIKKLVKENRQRFHYQTNFNNASIAGYYERNLIAPANWAPVFDTIGAVA
jgi:hypothetical protein